jgi:hypothetical protein
VADGRIPEVVAALTCQNHIVDANTKLRSLINIMYVFHAVKLPGPLQMGLYIKLVDGEGRYQLRVRLVRMSDDVVLADFPKQDIDWLRESVQMEVGINLIQQFAEPGLFEFQIFVDEMYVGRAPFKVMNYEPTLPTKPLKGLSK